MIYRKYLIRRILTFTNTATEDAFEKAEKSINLSSAMVWIVAAWKNVSSTTVKKCFQKAGFIETLQENETFEEEDDIPLSQLFSGIPGNPHLENYLQIDSNIPTENPSIDMQEIIQEFTSHTETTEDQKDERKEDQEVFSSSIKSVSEVCEKLRDLQNFFLAKENGDLAIDISNILMKCECEAAIIKIKNMKQTSIKTFFHKA